MFRHPIERRWSAGLAALAAVATAAVVVLHVASSRTGAEPAPAEDGAAGVQTHAIPPPAAADAFSPSAAALGDAQTVEASIAAYER
jgi:hypothetical protein